MMPVQVPEFWESQYQETTPGWDLGQPAPPFVELLRSPQAPRPGKTIVLGCGLGHDALWFSQAGFDVVGVDFAPSAIAAAQAQAQARHLSAQFIQRDIFALLPEFTGQFDYVIEHTCYCAIDPARRPDYAQLVRSLLRPGGELLGIFFTHARPGGPPFGTDPAAIRQIFAPSFELLTLEPVPESIPARQGEEHWARFRKPAS